MMKAVAAIFLLAFTLAQSLMQSGPPQTADTIYYNGRVVTMWAAHPNVEAVAIAREEVIAKVAQAAWNYWGR